MLCYNAMYSEFTIYNLRKEDSSKRQQ